MPTNKSSNLADEIDALREVFAALNRNDIPAILEFFDSQIVRIEPDGFQASGIYRGLAEVREHFTKSRETWAEGSCEPERFVGAGDKVVVFVHVRVRLKNQQEWIEGRIAEVFTFRNSKVTEMRIFVDSQKAVEWAGVKNFEVTSTQGE